MGDVDGTLEREGLLASNAAEGDYDNLAAGCRFGFLRQSSQMIGRRERGET